MGRAPGIITVEQLKAVCELEIENGNGDKQIYISTDDEGNSYHPLFFTFTPLTNDNKAFFEAWGRDELDPNKHIILG